MCVCGREGEGKDSPTMISRATRSSDRTPRMRPEHIPDQTRQNTIRPRFTQSIPLPSSLRRDVFAVSFSCVFFLQGAKTKPQEIEMIRERPTDGRNQTARKACFPSEPKNQQERKKKKLVTSANAMTNTTKTSLPGAKRVSKKRIDGNGFLIVSSLFFFFFLSRFFPRSWRSSTRSPTRSAGWTKYLAKCRALCGIDPRATLPQSRSRSRDANQANPSSRLRSPPPDV